MLGQLFDRSLNYALVLFLLSLIAYSSIGLLIDVSPVQADEIPIWHEPAQDVLGIPADTVQPVALCSP